MPETEPPFPPVPGDETDPGNPEPFFVGSDQKVGGFLGSATIAGLLAAEAYYAAPANTRRVIWGGKIAKPTAEAAAKAPGIIGVIFRPFIERFTRIWGRVFRAYNVDLVQWLVKWLDKTNTVFENYQTQQIGVFEGVADSFDYLVNTRLYGKKTGDIPDLRRGVLSLYNLLFDGQTGWIHLFQSRFDKDELRIGNIEGTDLPKVRGRIAALESSLYAPGVGWIWKLGAAIDNLSARIFDPQTGALTVLRTRFDNLYRDLLNPETGRITHLETQTQANTQRTNGLYDYLAPLLLAVPATAVAPFISTLVQNEPKLRRLCNLELDEVSDLLGLFAPLLSLALIVEIVRDGRDVAGAAGDVVGSILRGAEG